MKIHDREFRDEAHKRAFCDRLARTGVQFTLRDRLWIVSAPDSSVIHWFSVSKKEGV